MILQSFYKLLFMEGESDHTTPWLQNDIISKFKITVLKDY